MKPSDRLAEAAKQTTIVRDELAEVDEEELPEGVVEEIGTLAERIRRVRNAVTEVDR